jgi:primosomal replication protein N
MEQLYILLISIMCMAFLSWREFHRANKANLTLRLAASLMALTALYFIARPLSFQRPLGQNKEYSAVLLTPGFQTDSLTPLHNIPLYSTDPGIVSKGKNITLVPDLQFFTGPETGIRKVHIMGEGLESYELESLQSAYLVFHPKEISGFSAVNWDHSVPSGKELRVQGTYQNRSDQMVKLVLKGLNTTLDSVAVEAAHSQNFTLGTVPKTLGKTLYSLIALSGTDTLANEKIPVLITDQKPLRILMISSSPDFENKFLKRWLYAEKFAIAHRTRISKHKYSTEFLNTAQVNLSTLNPALLKKFDVLVGDMSALSDLSAAESGILRDQISQGLGLFITANEPAGKGFYRQAFNVRESRNPDQKSKILIWNNTRAGKAMSPASGNLEIIVSDTEQALVRDFKNHTLTALKLYGRGSIVLSTLNDTYTWMLSNDSSAYSAYWSFVLSKAARKKEAEQRWSHPRFASIHEPLTLKLESNPDSLPRAAIENSRLHFAQDRSMLFRWSAEYWPSRSGWQSVDPNDEDLPWYIFEKNDWRELKAVRKLRATQEFIQNKNSRLREPKAAAQTYTYAIPPLYFFLLFLLCCGYLWIEAKMR